MIKRILFVSLLLYLILFTNAIAQEKGKEKIPKRINVDNVEEDSLGLNIINEFNVYRNVIYLNSIVQYNTKDLWSFGLQLLNIPLRNNGAQNYEYDGYLTLTKSIKLSENDVLSIGTQVGTTLLSQPPTQIHNFSFVDNQYEVNDTFNFHIAAFYVNDALATIHQPFGIIAGFEYKVFPKKFHIQGDWYSGNSNVSGSVVNFNYYVLDNFQCYIGINVPAHNSGNEFAGNLGFNLRLK